MHLRRVPKSVVMVALLLSYLMLVGPAPAQQGSNNNGSNDIGNNNNGNNDIGNNNNGNNDTGNNNNGNNDTGNNNNGNNDTGNNNNGNNYTGNNNGNNDPGNTVPEIDPSSAVSAIALLAGGMLLFTDKRRCNAKIS